MLGFLVATVVALAAAFVIARLSAKTARLEGERMVLRALIDNMPDYMYVKDLESRFVIANPHLANEVGVCSPEELQGKTDYDFYPRELAEGFFQDEQAVIRTGVPMRNREEKGLDREGIERDILTTKVPIRDASGKIIGIAGVGRDISAQKGLEKALREAEAKYRGIFDKAIFGIFQSAVDGALLNVNPAMAFTFGYDSPDEMVEKIKDISAQLFTNQRRGIEFMLVMDKVGGVRNFECEMFCKDGRKIWISMSIRAIRESGAIVRYEGMCDEITERIQLREQLYQAQKLESVGQLAAGIAHEINSPVQYIGDNVQFLKDAFDDFESLFKAYDQFPGQVSGDVLASNPMREIEETAARIDAAYLRKEVPKAIEQALEGTSRVAALVNAMKEFSHPGSQEKAPLDLNHAIQNTITIARNEWKYVADVETEFDSTLAPVLCLPGEFNQVILNLIVNAAHAVGEVVRSGKMSKGKIQVRTLRRSNCAEIQIADNGTGIPDSVRSRIFDPFFTTKEVGKGTGQGLAIARSVVVNKHGGSIDFETVEGQGTTFTIRIPTPRMRVAV